MSSVRASGNSDRRTDGGTEEEMNNADAQGKIIITVTSPAPLTVAMIMDDIKDIIKAYAFEERIEDVIEIKEVNG